MRQVRRHHALQLQESGRCPVKQAIHPAVLPCEAHCTLSELVSMQIEGDAKFEL